MGKRHSYLAKNGRPKDKSLLGVFFYWFTV